jgi:hypothetical protein
VAKTLSGNIDSPVAGALVGPVVHVSGTVSVVGSGPPFLHQVDQVTVQVGTGSQVTAQVTGPANLNTFPRSRRSVRLGRPAIYFGRSRVRQAEAPRKRRARLPSISIWPMCGCLKAAAGPPGPRREPDGTQNRDWFAARRLVRTPWALTSAQPD